MIPVIDLAEDRPQIVQKVADACMNYGFFYVTNHKVDTTPAFRESKKFFDLPNRQKERVADSSLTRGYTKMREETLDPKNQKIPDTKEGFYISVNDIAESDSRYNPSKLTGPNQWPTKDNCPNLEDPSSFRTAMEEYLRDVTTLARRIVTLLAESLGLSSTHFDHAFAELPLGALRLLHYESTKSNTSEGIFACGAHSDYGMITLLATDKNDGLEIFYKGEWTPVPPRSDAFVVNLGDMLERWTNGKYSSTLHRVVNRNGSERYSMPYFFEPSFDTVVECLESCCSLDNPPRFPKTTSGEHLLSKYRETHADFDPVDAS